MKRLFMIVMASVCFLGGCIGNSDNKLVTDSSDSILISDIESSVYEKKDENFLGGNGMLYGNTIFPDYFTSIAPELNYVQLWCY